MFNSLRNLGSAEVIVIAVLVLLFFGGKKLSEFGQGIRQSKKELQNIKDELKKPDDGEKTSGGGS